LTPGPCCLGLEGSAELLPVGITDALGEMVIPHQVSDPQVFSIGHVVGPEKGERRLVMKVAPLPLHLLVLAGQQPRGFLPAFAPLLPAGEPFLRLRQRLLSLAVMARILDGLPLRGEEEHPQPGVHARLLAGRRQGLDGHPGTEEARVAAVRLSAEGDRLDGALEGGRTNARRCARSGT
jgi:hypothetical protein